MAKNELDLQMEDYQYLPLRDVVFRTLRQAILRGELKYFTPSTAPGRVTE